MVGNGLFRSGKVDAYTVRRSNPPAPTRWTGGYWIGRNGSNAEVVAEGCARDHGCGPDGSQRRRLLRLPRKGHIGHQVEGETVVAGRSAVVDGRLESQIHIVADLDRRLNRVDLAIDEAAKRGGTTAALAAIEGQRKTRAAKPCGTRQRGRQRPTNRDQPPIPHSKQCSTRLPNASSP